MDKNNLDSAALDKFLIRYHHLCNLTSLEYEAINLYTNKGYNYINDITDKPSEDVVYYRKKISSAIKKIKTLYPIPEVTYAGIGFELEGDKLWSFKTFRSTTLRAESAFEGKYFLEFITPNTGAKISLFSNHSSELEYLIDNENCFQIIDFVPVVPIEYEFHVTLMQKEVIECDKIETGVRVKNNELLLKMIKYNLEDGLEFLDENNIFEQEDSYGHNLITYILAQKRPISALSTLLKHRKSKTIELIRKTNKLGENCLNTFIRTYKGPYHHLKEVVILLSAYIKDFGNDIFGRTVNSALEVFKLNYPEKYESLNFPKVGSFTETDCFNRNYNFYAMKESESSVDIFGYNPLLYRVINNQDRWGSHSIISPFASYINYVSPSGDTVFNSAENQKDIEILFEFYRKHKDSISSKTLLAENRSKYNAYTFSQRFVEHFANYSFKEQLTMQNSLNETPAYLMFMQILKDEFNDAVNQWNLENAQEKISRIDQLAPYMGKTAEKYLAIMNKHVPKYFKSYDEWNSISLGYNHHIYDMCRNPDITNENGAIIYIDGVEDEVLLLKASYGEMAWSSPGGKLEAGETPWEGSKREMKEETGIDLDQINFRIIYSFSHKVPKRNSITYVFVVVGPRLDVKLSSEHTEWKYTYRRDIMNQSLMRYNYPVFMKVLNKFPRTIKYY